jgi:hypothetical protein
MAGGRLMATGLLEILVSLWTFGHVGQLSATISKYAGGLFG